MNLLRGSWLGLGGSLRLDLAPREAHPKRPELGEGLLDRGTRRKFEGGTFSRRPDDRLLEKLLLELADATQQVLTDLGVCPKILQ